MKNYKITIITPSLNQGQFLEQTIDSVLSQNYPNLEYIIIDGGSTDGSIDIIKKNEKHLAYWVSEPDRGQSHAINKGIRSAKGDILNWLNSDDYYQPDAFKLITEVFQQPGVTCLCGRSKIIDENENCKTSTGTDIYTDNPEKTIGYARIDQPETFFKREVWDRIGLLNEKLHYTMDREWWMRYVYYFGLSGIKRHNDELVNFRLHDTSKTVSSSDKFDNEHNTIFYLLAKAAKRKDLQELILGCNSIDTTISSDIEKWTDQEIIQKSLNYHLLKRADEFYYLDNLNAAKDYLSRINREWLFGEDLKLLKFLKIKTKLPLSVIHFFRA